MASVIITICVTVTLNTMIVCSTWLSVEKVRKMK